MRNFLSFGGIPTVIQLNDPGTTLIVGEDLDHPSTGESNGVGKSAIINALAYACYDSAVSKISKDKLVNNENRKDMEVIVEFKDNAGDLYKIQRRRKAKVGAAGNTVYLFKNGEDITPAGVDNTNAEIQKIIGIPYDLFVRIVVFSASHVPFLDLPVRSHYETNQTDIIEELFGLTELSAKAEILKKTIKDNEGVLKIKKVQIEGLEREQGRYEQQVKSAKQRITSWEEQKDQSIKQLEQKLAKIEQVDIDKERILHDTLLATNEDLSDALETQRATETQFKELSRALKTNESELLHLRDDKCPRCLQGYPSASTEIEQAEIKSDKLLAQLSKLKVDKALLDTKVSDLSKKHKQLRSSITVDDLEGLMQIKNQSETMRNKIIELQSSINPYLEPLEELENTALKPIDYEEINTLTRRIEHQNFLLKLLTKKDSFVRKALLNKNIPYLNSRLAHYLTELGLPHIVEFTHEMTASISQFTRELDFGNLSTGQRARVNLGLSFAFRDVLQSLYTKINICMLDEVLDVGLDSVGVQAAARMLKRKARDDDLSLYIVSHRSEVDGAFDKKMTVQLIENFSYIKQEQ